LLAAIDVLTALVGIDIIDSIMSKLPPSPLDLKSQSGQLLPFGIFGALVFGWVSSAHLDGFLSVYVTLSIAQLGTLAIYLLMRQLKSKRSKHPNRPIGGE
jgi:hypothetical protein